MASTTAAIPSLNAVTPPRAVTPPEPTAKPKPDDWDQTMSDVKKLIEALHSLIRTSSDGEPGAKPKPVSCSKLGVFTKQAL
jgi:hypothetical protein